MHTTETKQVWVKPELEIISKDIVKIGSDPYYAEGVYTPNNLAFGYS